MTKILLLISLLLLTSSPVCFADSIGDFNTSVNGQTGDPVTFVSGLTSLTTIKGLLQADFSDALTSNFGGLKDVLAVIIPAAQAGTTAPVFTVISESNYFGGLTIDMGFLPTGFLVLLNGVSLILTAWTAFTIVLRP